MSNRVDAVEPRKTISPALLVLVVSSYLVPSVQGIDYKFLHGSLPEVRPKIYKAIEGPLFPKESERAIVNQTELSLLDRVKAADYLEEIAEFIDLEGKPTQVLWDEYQTPIRNQRNRNTCSIFAMTAALEARYMRDYNLSLDLSEQYFWHVYKSTGVSHPKTYQYENQSSYWGGGNAHGVVSASTYAVPLEIYAPYKDGGQMNQIRQSIPAAGDLQWRSDPAQNTVTQDQVDAFEYSTKYIPTVARQHARYGIQDYILLNGADTQDPSKLECYLAEGNEVIVNVNLKWRRNTTTGIDEYDPNSAGGWHVFVLVGYDHNQEFFYVKNSWGESGFRKVHYDLMRFASNGGSVISEVTPPTQPRANGRFIGVWNMDHDGWKGKLTIRRAPKLGDPATRLGHYKKPDGTKYAVNGLAIDQGRGIQFTVHTSEYNDLGQMSGQMYYADIYSWDVNYASGYTDYYGTPFGLFLTRHDHIAPYGNNFHRGKWIGSWDMNHDGWRGTLHITNVYPTYQFSFPSWTIRWNILGSYEDLAGSIKNVSGSLTPGREHELKMNVQFSASNHQPFTLYYHTWDEDFFSGFTHWGGHRFGAHGEQ